ncbi:MAG: MFS transporter [Nitrososphaerales archaeon]
MVKLGNLWKHRDFMRLWLSDTVSQFGNQFTGFALPVLAVLTYKANAFETGALVTLAFLPYPTLGLFVGVWADRFRRRRIMIICNLGRMITLASIPISFLLGTLGLVQIFLVALVSGVFSVFFDIAYQSYLPVLIDRKDLVEGNQKLQMSASAAQVAGPGIAGVVYQLIGGAFTIIFDALGYLVSALSLISIKKREVMRVVDENAKPNFFGEMKEGIHVVLGNKILWMIAGSTATSNFGGNMIAAVYTIFALNYLHFSPVALGLVFTTGAVGFVIGVQIAPRFTAKLGVGVGLAVSISIGFVALANPLALYGYSFVVLSGVSLVQGIMIPIYNINAVSLRQAITPDNLQGRMNATTRTIVWGTLPVGSFLGGILGVTIGVVSTLYIGAVISGLAVLWIISGPVVKLKKQPAAITS